MVFRKLTLPQAHSALLETDARVAAVRAAARANGKLDVATVVQDAAAAAAVSAEAAASDMPAARPLLARVPPSDSHPGAEYRLAGDRYIQVRFLRRFPTLCAWHTLLVMG